MDITTLDYNFEPEAEASRWNISNHVNLEDLKMDSNFAMLLCSLLFAISWVVYITYYHSRVVGYMMTKIINKFFIRNGYFKIGSFTLNALSGKIMFRDVIYITPDYSVRVQDGYLIFRWWRSYVPKDVSTDLSHSDTRLSAMLNGFELHVYNRSQLYSRLEKLFGLGSDIFVESDSDEEREMKSNRDRISSEADRSVRKQRSEAAMARTWRDLIPVIKVDVSSARIVFGNRLVPTTLSITVEESHFVYSTKPAVCTLDRFMHFTKCKAENARVMLVPSPKYTGMLDEPPRYMGEGFVLMSTNYLELYFYMDEPGLVPDEPVSFTLANGDVVEPSPPQWGVDIKCGKGTDFSYGPWADRQRENLFKFFYPQDYLPMEVTETPKPGDIRQMQSFDVRLSMQNEATIDILFTKNKETNAVHVNVGAGSYLEITIPWVTLADGYTTRINGQLLHLDATTSLQFRDLICSETLEFCISCRYPLVWNDHQLWEISLTGCKATLNLVFNHKWFFQDLVNDWSSKQRPDIVRFVPYTYRMGITLKHCELLTIVNQYNWIDCSSVGQRQRLENTQLALCAHFLHLSFDLPFDEFLPETVSLNFSIQGESIDLSLFIPEYHTSRNVVVSLEKCAKVLSKDGLTTEKTEIIPKWRNICQPSSGWIDFWWIPIGAINIAYVYHPCPPLGPAPQADISTPVKEEILLSPMRFPHHRKGQKSPDGMRRFDPTTLKADVVTVELEIGPSVFLLYGTTLRSFLNFKENIFGEDQNFTDMQQSNSNSSGDGQECKGDDLSSELQEDFDHRTYRPLEVDVSVIMHDIQAHLLKYCTEKDAPCPIILVERFGFEMKKRYDQTELQLLLSPSILLIADNLNRPVKDKHLNRGKLTVSSVQIRGHAMFSDVGRSLDQDTVEYAWLIEIQTGKVSGKLTAPQLHSLVVSLETLLLLASATENELNSPTDDALLARPSQTKQTTVSPTQNLQEHVQQAIQQLLQPKNHQNHQAKKTDDANNKEKRPTAVGRQNSVQNNEFDVRTCDAHKLKYKLTRVAVDAVDFWLVESGVALQLWVSPVRLANCNLHGKHVTSGLSCTIYDMSLRQLLWQPQKYHHGANTEKSTNNKTNTDGADLLWLEVGAVDFGPLVLESAVSADSKEQNLCSFQQKFLKTHDDRFKKLWFLWPELNKSAGKCGCTGGCVFFGSNRNGSRFFKPSRRDLEEGRNVAAFRVNEPGKDPGFGQSILHEGLLIFRTPPYVPNEITLQDQFHQVKGTDSPRISVGEREQQHSNCSRRYSSTSIIRSRDVMVPYARLLDTCPPPVLPLKLDSDSMLHTEKGKLTADGDAMPKSSISDSKLAVDYFNAPRNVAVNSSESRHSLNARIKSEEQVQRTFSMSSENHSEAFFSADEDLNSRSSASKPVVPAPKREGDPPPNIPKKFSSEQSVLVDQNCSSGCHAATTATGTSNSAPESGRFRLSTHHRSDHEIHTPEHRSFIGVEIPGKQHSTVEGLVTPHRHRSAQKSASLRFPKRMSSEDSSTRDYPSVDGETEEEKEKEEEEEEEEECEDDDDMMGSSDSYGSTSYASAMGSQEDFTLVDLHMQVNRLITDSPMLMSSYVTHLSQKNNETGKLVYVGGRLVPWMETVTEGVTSLKMISRTDNPNSSASSNRNASWPDIGDPEETDTDTSTEELLSVQRDGGSRVCILIKMRGDLDIMISPPLLESFQKFVDALTPTFAALHPLTVLDHLHLSCIDRVESLNVLKTTENIARLEREEREEDGSGTVCATDGRYDETIKKRYQASVHLPKINVTILQVSIVEEVISFSALDNIKDLTCVSLFSASLENVTAKFHSDRQVQEVLQKFLKPSVVQTDSKKGTNRARHFLGLHTNTNADIIRCEPVFVESREKQQQQFVFCLNVGKVHAQLRRLRNESSLLDDAVITAIPPYSSKVLFTSAKATKKCRGVEYYLQPAAASPPPPSPPPPPPPNTNDQSAAADCSLEDKLGFVMFESGLEGVSIKILKRSQFEQTECNLSEKTQKFNEDVHGCSSPKCDNKPSEQTGEQTEETNNNTEDVGNNVSSCVIDLKVVWFNFAAPPRAPITRKIDFTRLDWNLLSTASPAINAWMNPSNRLAIRTVHMVRTMYRRSTAAVASLMAEALDIQGVHMPIKSRYGKLTPLAKTLQEDPSCQLCTVLRKYYLQCDPAAVESNLRESELPQLYTLRQGIIVLARQWKNILYTPLLPENSVKSRNKPVNVTIAVPPRLQESYELYVNDTTEPIYHQEEMDVTDEHARLLQSGIVLKPNRNLGFSTKEASCAHENVLSPQVAIVSGGVESVLTSPSPPAAHRIRNQNRVSTGGRPGLVLPLLQNANIFGQKRTSHDDHICYGTLYEDGTVNLGSDASGMTHSSPDLPSSPLHHRSGEDLYSWMAKQDAVTSLKGCMESKIDMFPGGGAQGEEETASKDVQVAPGVSFYPVHDSVRLLDANLVFQPFVSALGVIPQQLRFTTVTDSSDGNDVTTLDALGSNLSLVGNMETMRIDIVVSENGKWEKKKGKNKGRRAFGDTKTDESPAFVCEKVSVELEVDRMTDMAVDEMFKTRNILYISRGQLKNHTSTILNFNVGVRYISQRVNMPLLRLLHQISNMYQNVKDTQNELREQQPENPTDRNKSGNADVKQLLSPKTSDTFRHRTVVLSPSVSLRSRPQSFALKLRSTGKSVKGYVNLNLNDGEGETSTPITANSPSGSALECVTVSSDKSGGRCWKTVYHLLDLYANMPDTKTIRHRFSVGAGDISEHNKGNRKYDILNGVKRSESTEKENVSAPKVRRELSLATKEHTKLVIFGIGRIHRTRLLATLSGLKLEAEITSLHSSLTVRKKSEPASLESSVTGQVGRTMIVLLEGVAPNQQTVVRVTVGKSQAIYSSVSKRTNEKNSGLLTVGAVSIDIPQHPVALHGMVTRGSKQLSSTLQELRVTRASSRLSKMLNEEENTAPQTSPNKQTKNTATVFNAPPSTGGPATAKGLLQPLVMEFSIILQSLSITAALLPSLQAQYKMDQVNSTGITGNKANFTVLLPHHSLSFTTKLKGYIQRDKSTDPNLPSEASIALPEVHVAAEYIPENASATSRGDSQKGPEGVVFRQGGYLKAHADIGVFEHSLTTDLLNHLVFVQKVFMKEVNEVVQKVYGGERPVAIWSEDVGEEQSSSSLNRILFSLVIRIKGIQLTATTAGSSAVRLETGVVELEVSNRVQNISGSAENSTSTRFFGRAQVDLKVSLGQIIRNALFEEAEIEYQPVAFFYTRIGLRNAFQDEIMEGDDKEVVLITLKRPLIYIQPVAVDKAILVWLNYKNAYDYWNEKRANLNREMSSSSSIYEKFQLGQITSQLGSPMGTLFLQLTVEDMGICLPLNPLPPNSWGPRPIYEERGAVVITLENTSISACSSGSLVSKGKFSNLCLRFADDFENSLDDWKPDMSDSSIMNLCLVSDGTYEVCSRTIAAKHVTAETTVTENAKWFLNVQWQMEGVDIHLDTNVGKQLSALGYTLTMLTGAEDAPVTGIDYDSDENDPAADGTRTSQESILPAFMFDPSLDNKKRSKLIEKEMNEQANIIRDLRSLGASHGTIESEMKRLRELEAMVYKDFRRDMIQKLRRQSVKASSIKGKFGLGSRAAGTYRSRSFIASGPSTQEPMTAETTAASYESSPRSGPSRSASLRAPPTPDDRPSPRVVTFVGTADSSGAGSDLSLPETRSDCWTTTDHHHHHHHHLTVDGETVELRKKIGVVGSGTDSTADGGRSDVVGGPGSFQVVCKQSEPNIDLELDVKVLINSGKCVLHTKDPEETRFGGRMRKDRSCSAGLLEFPPPQSSSPDPSRRNKDKTTLLTGGAGGRLRNLPHQTLVDLTIFHIPGMDVKLHYQSKVTAVDEDVPEAANKRPPPPTPTPTSDDGLATGDCPRGITNPNYDGGGSSASASVVFRKAAGIKKASLFVWMTLQSVPEETIISPHILEFLEQTLEPIPTKTNFSSTATASSLLLDSVDDEIKYGNYVYASFPVDVVVYFHMQPSTFRFSCLPVSRVECMLQLPSLDIVFSSKRAEDELLHSEFGDGAGAPNTAATAVGGLSVTGCLSDFSVYIFHPYGGKKSTLKETQWSPLADSERKDSLSINVEFVKFHLSRSRMMNFKQETCKNRGKPGPDQSRAVIRFSTITDIGSASFKYDMRRLTEILAFPKAWYRRSIVRRMFLGDLSASATHEDDGDGDVFPGHSRGHQKKSDVSEKSPLSNDERRQQWRDAPSAGKSHFRRTESDSSGPSEMKSSTAWETLVLFAINFKKLNVHMNMGNVMGNVMWLTKDFRSEGRLSIGSTGHKNLYIAFGLGGSGLDAKGGIVGGNIEIAKIDTFIHIREEPDVEPDHTVGLRLHALELRLDYMATSVLMCRVSDLNVNLRDEWKLNGGASSSVVFIPTRRPASIFMHGDLSWDQLQMMMSKSSTADLLKMFNKLEEFFSQQFNSSKRAFSGFSSTSQRPSRISTQKISEPTKGCQQQGTTTTSSSTTDGGHHRHWQRVLAQVAGFQMSTMHVPLPQYGTVLGGTVELHGNNISLACFHGINFKSKSWALFSLREPCITFNTEAQEISSIPEATRDVHVVQTLTCSLGLSTYKTHLSMATVCKVSRSVIFPPQFKTLQEWFHYAFANSQIDEVDRFPSLERERWEGGSIDRGRGSTGTHQKLADSNHNREVIFALPSLQLHLKTEHLQTALLSDSDGEKPKVECSFITEFEDHIFVTVDAELFFFLHDLITSYLREREKVSAANSEKRSNYVDSDKFKPPSPATGSVAHQKKSLDVEMFARDSRDYNCKTWHLEPTVRLLSVAGKYIESYGIDYILQKLGFSQARITIPKWVQRGFMDPLDAVLALLIHRMVQVIKEDGNKVEKSDKK